MVNKRCIRILSSPAKVISWIDIFVCVLAKPQLTCYRVATLSTC